jgi:hypothetical protein
LGWISTFLPVQSVLPATAIAALAWRDAGRQGAPRLVAVVYCSAGLEQVDLLAETCLGVAPAAR